MKKIQLFLALGPSQNTEMSFRPPKKFLATGLCMGSSPYAPYIDIVQQVSLNFYTYPLHPYLFDVYRLLS